MISDWRESFETKVLDYLSEKPKKQIINLKHWIFNGILRFKVLLLYIRRVLQLRNRLCDN
ncbi:hypothetical protein Rahaq2_3980 [Rahnella aquatilis CIP 78.65 = ATCC 33071]|uniref:Uncharacterized protein n=1 Tax=Rahnella aquatilis (strain ATCC 33071 / DSM 4594 / JCM 1683 / NBRC 105701 / NCIMB 13365 / CIP 78.65) TaxID=745277 RepID=H2ISQ0_RAHAC|nr:hypothetical protein Rahaq2_3980 [Rahnella aquatilis CIP 78.65 = ATCC 33071]